MPKLINQFKSALTFPCRYKSFAYIQCDMVYCHKVNGRSGIDINWGIFSSISTNAVWLGDVESRTLAWYSSSSASVITGSWLTASATIKFMEFLSRQVMGSRLNRIKRGFSIFDKGSFSPK